MYFFESRKNLMEKLASTREALMTTEAVAKWLGVSTRTVCLWAECNEIPAIKVGRQWRFREGEVSQWLRSPRAATTVNNHPNGLSRGAGS
jgi:excisionase family DNA binding protein